MDFTEKIKNKALLKLLAPAVKDFIPWIKDLVTEEKKKVILLSGEADVIAFAFIDNDKIYISIATIDGNKTIQRQMETFPLDSIIEKFNDLIIKKKE